MWHPLSSVRSYLSQRLTPERKAWISKLRHGEHSWQRPLDRGSKRSPTIATGFDARAEQRRSLASVRDALSVAGVDFVELPTLSSFSPTLVTDADYAAPTIEALMSRLGTSDDGERDSPEHSDDWRLGVRSSEGAEVSLGRARRRPGTVTAIVCQRHIIAPNCRELSTSAQKVTVEFWDCAGSAVPRADGGAHLPGTLIRRRSEHDLTVDYIEPAVWHAAQKNDSRLDFPAPHLKVLHEPVDIVYTWVDGSDSEWRDRMRNRREGLDLRTAESSSISESRFTSRDELKYSLRSLEYYASWARHIYIVTDRQIPAWLDTSHPKITVVDHREIFADPDVLPVFNSHAIESQLHHIEGLSDHYLYLNDDCFFLRPTEPGLFFTANGLAKHFPSIVPIDIGSWSPRDLPINSAAKQGREYLLSTYGRTVTHRFKHTPHPQLRPVLDEMESEHPQLFAKVAASPFRSPEDMSIPSSLHHFDAFARGRSVEGQINYQFVDLGQDDLELRLGRVARRTDLDVFCLNETDLPHDSEDTVNEVVERFLADRFPVPSSFELCVSETESATPAPPE
ncbi:stealth family protein [Brevibacterium sp. GP-SGM9]|uniref:stealth family protein n=1 Tax=Brevibacterium sp. GP-SGM9 TaxID=3376990 RepID=UPI0039A60DBC